MREKVHSIMILMVLLIYFPISYYHNKLNTVFRYLLYYFYHNNYTLCPGLEIANNCLDFAVKKILGTVAEKSQQVHFVNKRQAFFSQRVG